MSSSNRLLAAPRLGSPRSLQAPEPALDPFVRARIEEAEAAGYERGRRDGAEEACRDLTAATDRVERAFAAVCAEIRALREQRVEADIALGEAIAEAVLGREPHDGGRALLARLREALAGVEERPLTVRVHAADARVVAEALARDGGVEVTADAALAPGEARVEGRWAAADLTRPAAMAAVREALAAGEHD